MTMNEMREMYLNAIDFSIEESISTFNKSSKKKFQTFGCKDGVFQWYAKSN